MNMVNVSVRAVQIFCFAVSLTDGKIINMECAEK